MWYEFAIKQKPHAITNLLANVLAHNPPGTQVLATLDAGGQITIADSGNPIPPKIAEHLFCPFVSGDESRLTKNGSGLGLAISQKIMEKQNGKLTYQPGISARHSRHRPPRNKEPSD